MNNIKLGVPLVQFVRYCAVYTLVAERIVSVDDLCPFVSGSLSSSPDAILCLVLHTFNLLWLSVFLWLSSTARPNRDHATYSSGASKFCCHYQQLLWK